MRDKPTTPILLRRLVKGLTEYQKSKARKENNPTYDCKAKCAQILKVVQSFTVITAEFALHGGMIKMIFH